MNKKRLAYCSSSLASIIGGSSFIFSKLIMETGLSFIGMVFWRMIFEVITMLLLIAAGPFPLYLHSKSMGKAALVSLFYPRFGLL